MSGVPSPASRRAATALLVLLVGVGLAAVVPASPAQARNRATPGNFTGYGFDQCVAPSQAAMDAWLTSSPFWAVGIYIAGDSRACPDQPNLTKAWVRAQLRNGWRLLPITVGPQASCTTREAYQHDRRIIADPAHGYARARQQGRAEAGKTARAAGRLGIAPGSTLWYDLEAFSISGRRCRESAISFLSGWTRKLHTLRYVSGVYSSAASGIKMLDDAHDAPAGRTLPDRIWIADWNGRADIHSSFIRPTTWMPHKRVHQYRGGHVERHGGVAITIDSNYMSLGRGSIAPGPQKSCGVRTSFPDYHRAALGDRDDEIRALHCLLSRKGDYRGAMRPRFDARTEDAVRSFQRGNGLRPSGVADLRTWTALLAGGGTPVLKYGSADQATRRLQRALNAATDAHLPTSGAFFAETARAVRHYQRLRGLPRTGVVDGATWRQLQRGRI